MNNGFLVALIAGMVSMSACSREKVEAGNVGIIVNLYGNEKGVEQNTVGPGIYWIGLKEDLYRFPTFTQTYRWTASKEEQSRNNEEFSIQTGDGMSSTADVGVSYRLNPEKIPELFQRYRKQSEEITQVVLKTKIRNYLNQFAALYQVEELYGEKKSEFITKVKASLVEDVGNMGIDIEDVYIIGAIRPPQNVTAAINLKVEATQKVQQKENEKREAIADAEKLVAKAEGDRKVAIEQAKGVAEATRMQAQAEADSITIKAKAEADAIKLKTQAITSTFVEYTKVSAWNGELPTYMGGNNTPIIDLRGN